MLPIPATFVVAQDGHVKARFIDPDFRQRMEVEDLLDALRRLADTLNVLPSPWCWAAGPEFERPS